MSIFLFTLIHSWLGIWLYTLVIPLSRDVEVNPGPRTKATVHKFDIVCLSETCLDSNTAPDNNNLEISGYNLIRSGRPSNSKRGGVCIYYKNFLHMRVLDIQY